MVAFAINDVSKLSPCTSPLSQYPFYRMVKVWNAKLDEHLSHDPAIVSTLGLYPRPAKIGKNANTIEIGGSK